MAECDSKARSIHSAKLINACSTGRHLSNTSEVPSTCDSTKQHGGYNYEFLEAIPEKFICSICIKVMRDPYQVMCCGIFCCHSCLQKSLKNQPNQTCPSCPAAEDNEKPFQQVAESGMKSNIESFYIRCINERRGCGWKGRLRYLNEHLLSDHGCLCYEVDCPNKCEVGINGCTKVLRKNLSFHLEHRCRERKVECPYCFQFFPLGFHQWSCKMRPAKCPNICGEEGLTLQTVKAHCQTCKLQVIKCEYNEVGCSEKYKREDMPQHMADDKDKHLTWVTQAYTKVRDELESLKLEVLERRGIVKRELSLVDYGKSSGENSDWAHSLDTQFQTFPHADGKTLYFRMLSFNQIKEGRKQWSSFRFDIGSDCKLCLHVFSETRGTLKLELCLLKGPKDATYLSKINAKLNIEIKDNEDDFPADIQSHCSVFIKSGLFWDANDASSPLPTADESKLVLKSWQMHINSFWERTFVGKDSVLWLVCGTSDCIQYFGPSPFDSVFDTEFTDTF